MATYWLGEGGGDGNDGSTYALRKATTGAALALLTAKGDVLNIVGTVSLAASAYTINGAALGNAGSSYSDPAITIRGADSAGDPAWATLQGDATNALFVQLTDQVNYVIFKGLHFDLSTQPNSTTVYPVRITGAGHTPVKFTNCVFEGQASYAASRNPYFPYATADYDVTQEANAEVLAEYCVFKHAIMAGDEGQVVHADHCIYQCISIDYSGHAIFVRHQSHSVVRGPGAKMTNCTIDLRSNYTAVASVQASLFSDNVIDGTVESRNRQVHSNLVCVAATRNLSLTGVFNAGVINNQNANVTGVWSGTVGYNVFVLDTNFTSVLDNSANIDIYVNHYHPDQPTTVDGTQLYTTDVLMEDTTISDVINTTAAWTWVSPGGGDYDIDLDKDYRVDNSVARTAAADGGAVGAIADPVNLPPVGSNQSYAVLENQQLAVLAASGLLVGSSDPNPEHTPSVTAVGVPSNGTLVSYNTTTGSFVYQPDGFFVGTDSFTFRVTDGITNSDAYTASIAVSAVGDGDEETEEATRVRLIDTAPFWKPTLKVATEFRFKATKNRHKHHDLANYTEDLQWSESTHRVIDVGVSTTVDVTLGGVSAAEYMIVETDNDIDVSINDEDRYWSVSKCAAVALGNIERVYLRNNSATNVAQVILAVAD